MTHLNFGPTPEKYQAIRMFAALSPTEQKLLMPLLCTQGKILFRILNAIAEGPKTYREIATECGYAYSTIALYCSRFFANEKELKQYGIKINFGLTKDADNYTDKGWCKTLELISPIDDYDPYNDNNT